MPILAVIKKNTKLIFVDKVSTIFFRKDFLKLLHFLNHEYKVSYPSVVKAFLGERIKDLRQLVDESINLLKFTYNKNKEIPRVFFFAVFPRDFLEVVSLLLGGASSITVPLKDGVYVLDGGLGEAALYKDNTKVRDLVEGEEIKLGNLLVKVFSKTAYDVIDGPIKTIIVLSLIAMKENGELQLVDTSYLNMIYRK